MIITSSFSYYLIHLISFNSNIQINFISNVKGVSMFSKIVSCGIRGVEGYQVAIETDISSGGLPSQKNYHQSFTGRAEKGRYCL